MVFYECYYFKKLKYGAFSVDHLEYVQQDGVDALAKAGTVVTGPLNAAVDTFVQNTAPLLPRGIRVNVVSPAPIVEPGQEGKGVVTAAETAKLYVEAVESNITGKVLRAWGGLPFSPE